MADAELLHTHSRPANADHLAGFAAECALKALIAGFLGGHVNQKNHLVAGDVDDRAEQIGERTHAAAYYGTVRGLES